MGVSTASVISELIRNGIFATINQSIDYDTASLVAAEMGMELIPKGGGDGGDGDAPELVAPGAAEDGVRITPGATTTRPTSSAGADRHDHGPRRSRQDQPPGRHPEHRGRLRRVRWHHPAHRRLRGGPRRPTDRVPRHALATRRSPPCGPGAQVTDIAVIVVAADDGVMPHGGDRPRPRRARPAHHRCQQDRQARREPRSGQAGAVRAWRPDRGVWRRHPVRGGVGQAGDRDRRPARGHRPGGRPPDLKANPNREAYGTIIESKVDKGRGNVATVLVQTGTLKVGDIVTVGKTSGASAPSRTRPADG